MSGNEVRGHVPQDDGTILSERGEVASFVDPAHRKHGRLVANLHDDPGLQRGIQRRRGRGCSRRRRILAGTRGSQQSGTAAQQKTRNAHLEAPWRLGQSPKPSRPIEHSMGFAGRPGGVLGSRMRLCASRHQVHCFLLNPVSVHARAWSMQGVIIRIGHGSGCPRACVPETGQKRPSVIP